MTDLDRPSQAERYGDAVAAGKIRDIVGAVGMAGRNAVIGALLWRALHGGDRSVLADLRTHLFAAVDTIAKQGRWRHEEQLEARPLAARVLHWYLAGVCPACQGRKYRTVPGVDRVLSDAACQQCHGLGRTGIERAVPVAQALRAREIAAYLDGAEHRMSDRVRQAMRRE